MARLEIHGDRLRVAFTTAEHLWGLVRDLDVPVSSVFSATEVHSWREVRGLRLGLAIPGVWLLGHWRSPGRRQLVALRRGRPAVRVLLKGEKYDELLIETPDPVAVVARLDGRKSS